MSNIQNKHALGLSRVWKNKTDLSAVLEVVFYLQHKQEAGALQNLMQHPAKRKYSTVKAFQKKFTTDTTGITTLKSFINQYDLNIVSESTITQAVKVSGTLDEFEKAFKVEFSEYTTLNGEEHIGYQGVINLPEDLDPYILSISGLNKGLIKGYRFRVTDVATDKSTEEAVEEPKSVSEGYSPQDIAGFYNFPTTDAEGQCIGLIELGGDYKVSDIEQYCKHFKVPMPQIIEVGTKPVVSSSDQMIDNLEVTLDIQMIAGLATKAKIVIYYGASIPEAMHLAIHDTKNKPSVLSISWAISEHDSSVADRNMMDQLSYQASLQGITIVAASGDYGAFNKKSFPNVMLPASNPFVLGCGGTDLYISENKEQVWNSNNGNASGGGYSAIYKVPNYQKKAIEYYKGYIFPHGNIGRGVPDISANSAPETAYSIVINGKLLGIGAGTSAATPVWASLIAVLNKSLGYQLGYINSLLYSIESSKAFKQIIKGNNNLYPAAYGWNPATGLGAPNGIELKKSFEYLARYSDFIENEISLIKKEDETIKDKPESKTAVTKTKTMKKQSEKPKEK